MEKNVSPYLCHIFVCTNDRKGERKSCADGNSTDIRKALKEEVNMRGWKGKVRVSKCGCLGLCQKGPNIILYPQKEWFSEVLESDVPAIISEIESIMKGGLSGT
jgi:(2Fe-2S) ferredoxin